MGSRKNSWKKECSEGLITVFFENVTSAQIFCKQECIPVGCVPSAAVTVSQGSASLHAGIPTPLDHATPRDQAPPGPGTPPVDRHTPAKT